MSTRKVSIMNFNLTFGIDEEPMLDYFDTLVYPAFTSGIKKIINQDLGTCNFLYNIKLEKRRKDDYILTGKIVKDTILEIKSQLVDGEMIDTDYEYPSAPYSFFCIYLKNHRMYLVRNQNGSPDIKSFRSTVQYILKEFVNNLNKNLEKEEYPIPYLEVIGIPLKANIKKELDKVETIKSITLNFFPLNGDTDFSEAFSNISIIRQNLDSKTGKVIYNSPKNKSNVGELISQTRGTVDPVLNVVYNDTTTGVITNDKLSESIYVDTEDNLDNKSIEMIKNKADKTQSIQDMSGNHMKIFKMNQQKILNVLEKYSEK